MDQQPLRLSDYVQHLAEVALPVQARSLETLRRVDVEALTNTELATIMYRDPALCISLLARAAALQKRPENRIATVDQAILLLGTRGSLHWALQQPVAEYESIRPYMTLGCDGNPLLPELFLTVSPGSRLRPYLRDGQWMRLDARQLRDLLGVTHHPSHRVFVCEQALIAPIRTADGLQGLLYADQGSNDCGLHETAVQGFPDTCHALETGLSHLHLPQLLSLD